MRTSKLVQPAIVTAAIRRALGFVRMRWACCGGAGTLRGLSCRPASYVDPPPAGSTAPVVGSAAVAAGGRYPARGWALPGRRSVVTTRNKTVSAAVAVLLALLAWLSWPEAGAPPASPPVATPASPPATDPAQAAGATVAVADVAPAAAPGREVLDSTAERSGTGTLLVHVRHGDDGTPAAGVLLTLRPPGCDPRYEGRRKRTDERGTATYEELAPGQLYVSDGNSPGKRVEIAAGETTEVALELDAGMTVRGIVVDPARAPVAGALVETAPMARADALPEMVAMTGADGRFAIRAAPTLVLVGARAHGYTASPVRFLHGKEGNTAEVELVLGPDGGSVDGLVVDGDGEPVADAVVILGAGEVSGIAGREHIPPFAALARSDAEGRFRAVGIPAGGQPVRARAPGFAPHEGTCEIAAGTTVPLRIELQRGAVIRGHVRGPAGRPAARAEIEIGGWDDLAHYRTRSGSDGAFELQGLPVGELELRASHDDLGKATSRVRTEAGTPVVCELQLSRGLELQGRLVDGDGQPVASAVLECMADEYRAGGWFTFARADAQGRFVATNCPEQGTIRITVRATGFEDLLRRGIDPKAGEVELQLQRLPESSVRITGTVVGPDGRPVANASVGARRTEGRGGQGLRSTDDGGRFELGPYPPGTWSVWVRSPGHPAFRTEERALGADATWDLGTITLVRGGTAVLRQLGPAVDGVRFHATAVDRSGHSTFGDDGGRLRSSVLAAGDYHLMVSGAGVAAQAVPFTIRPGEETTVDVQVEEGTVQRCECELPAGAEVPGATLRFSRGGAFCGQAWAPVRTGQPPAAEVCLAPGFYTVTAEAGDLRGTATFTVGAGAGPPVRVALR